MTAHHVRWLALGALLGLVLGCDEATAQQQTEEQKGAAPGAMQIPSEEMLFETFDVDQDQRVTRDEFSRSFEQVFQQLDADGDGALEPREISRVVLSAWTGDPDEPLSEQQFRQALDTWLRPNASGFLFRRLDADGNDRISQQEITEAIRAADATSLLDGDGDDRLEQQEVGDALFGLWDQDGDGVVTPDEWQWKAEG